MTDSVVTRAAWGVAETARMSGESVAEAVARWQRANPNGLTVDVSASPDGRTIVRHEGVVLSDADWAEVQRRAESYSQEP